MQSLGSLISHTRRLCNFDMDTLVQRVGDMLSGEAAQKGVDIVIQHDLSLGVGYGDAEGVILLFAHVSMLRDSADNRLFANTCPQRNQATSSSLEWGPRLVKMP